MSLLGFTAPGVCFLSEEACDNCSPSNKHKTVGQKNAIDIYVEKAVEAKILAVTASFSF